LLLVDSLYYIFARLLLPLLPPAAGAMYMMVVGVVQVILLMGGRVDWRVLSRHRWLFLTIGILVGVNTNMGFVAVRYVDPGTASLLSRTSILFTVALGVAWLGERLRRLEIVGAAIAVAGVAVISFQPAITCAGALCSWSRPPPSMLCTRQSSSATRARSRSASSCSSASPRWRPCSSCWPWPRAPWCGRPPRRGAGWPSPLP